MKLQILFVLSLFLSTAAQADILDDSKALCDKIRSCALVEIDQQGLADETKNLILGSFDTQCLSAVKKYKTKLDDNDLEDQAEACLSSMQALSCEALLSQTDQEKTESCREFESAAEKAGVKVNS